MKTTLHAMRLIKLARHLIQKEMTKEESELIKTLKKETLSDHLGCFPFVFNELPNLFDE